MAIDAKALLTFEVKVATTSACTKLTAQTLKSRDITLCIYQSPKPPTDFFEDAKVPSTIFSKVTVIFSY